MAKPISRLRGIGLCTGILFALCGLTACERAPTDTDLTSDLSKHVETGYAPGLLEVTTADRTNPWHLPRPGADRRTIAFSAALRLKRDYDFGVWEQPNAAALTYLLGAQPHALSGIKAGGNKSGDILHVTGEVVYIREGDLWRLESGVPAATLTPNVSSDQWLRLSFSALRALMLSPTEIIQEDIAPAIKSATAKLRRRNGNIALASGPEGSDYWSIMEAVASVSTSTEQAPLNISTSGSRENLRLLRQNSVTAAIMRGDEAALAAAGAWPYEHDGTFPDLRALASLFPEQVHVIVLAGSQIASVADLFGKRVAVATGEPVAVLQAGDVLRAHRVPLSALAAPPTEISVSDALDALARGEQDAVIVTAPAPVPALRNFAVSHAVRLLPLDADAVALMTSGTSNYVAVSVPIQTYPGQGKPIATVGVTALLVSTEQVPAAETETLLRKVFTEVDFMRLGSPAGTMIKASSARRGMTLPLHSGAEAFYGTPESPK
jgi:TRAP transporter TAXI family solute receptor